MCNFSLNLDQTVFNYEIPTTRTLSLCGEKDTLLSVQSVHACTHSLTIQPTISLSGRCVGKLLICLQESSDNFGPLVQRDINTLLETVKNVSVICSKSGKMSNKLINQWIGCLTNTYDNIDGQMNILLLLDSYSAHWNKEFDCIQ